MIALGISKRLLTFGSHQEAEKFVLESGFNLSPEDRIRWLYQHMKMMNEMNPNPPKIIGYQLKKKGA